MLCANYGVALCLLLSCRFDNVVILKLSFLKLFPFIAICSLLILLSWILTTNVCQSLAVVLLMSAADVWMHYNIVILTYVSDAAVLFWCCCFRCHFIVL